MRIPKLELIFIMAVITISASEIPLFGERIFHDEFAIEYSPSPSIVDWDGDGLQDIVVGYAYYMLTADKGTLAFLKNVGTEKEPVFERQDDIKAGGEYLLTGWDA